MRSLIVSIAIIFAVIAVAGFAAFTPSTGADDAGPIDVAAPSARVSSALFAGRLAAPTTVPAAPQVDAPAATEAIVLDAQTIEPTPEPSTSPGAARATSTTAPPTTAATTTTVPETTTTEAPTTTSPPATTTTTTAPPETTTTTAPPDTTTTTEPPAVASSFPAAVEQWRALVAAYFPADRVDEALTVIDCESNGNPSATNPRSGAAGLFQFIPGTWASASNNAGRDGADVYDPDANVAVAAWLVDYSASQGQHPWHHWTCRP